jgi:hypothetical protein
MEAKLIDLFEEWQEAKTLAKVRKELEETSTVIGVKRKGVEREEVRRGRSAYVLDSLHDAVGENHLDCKNAESGCLEAMIKQVVTARLALDAIDSLAVLLPALYHKPNYLAVEYSRLSKAFQEKFKDDEEIVKHAKLKLHLPKEARILQQINYNAKVTKANAKQRELSDTHVLKTIAQLREAKDYISQICLVGLACGSRISEICLVSEFTPGDNIHWVKVIGVAKARDQKQATKREVGKPVILLTSQELIDVVKELRMQLEAKYNYNLGTGQNPNGEIPLAKKMTGLVDAKANTRIRELFGEEYVFHDTRAIYSQIAFITYAPPSMSQTAFYSQVLGHKENSLTTALSYQTFNIRRKLQEHDPDLAAKITNLEVR